MTSQEGPEEPAVASVDSVLAEFNSKKELLAMLCAKTKNLIEECLDDAQIRYQSVQARVKKGKKLQSKYTDPQKNYRRLDDITDLVGLRIITYYEDEIDLVAEVIRREFEIDSENSADRRISEPDRFGYYAINYIVRHSAQRLRSVEYKRFSGQCCEIQITSILRHAWAEIQHEWYDLRDEFPDQIKRRFARMAALLEVAESEFLELKKSRVAYQRSIAVQLEANVPNLALDAFSLQSFVEQDHVVTALDQAIAAVRGFSGVSPRDEAVVLAARIANRAGLKTIEDLRGSLKRYEKAVMEYIQKCQPYLATPGVGSSLPRGACVYYLGVLLISVNETLENLVQAVRDAGSDVVSPEARSVVAREVMAKYSG
jgi:putative GTP pyrophosphokinase